MFPRIICLFLLLFGVLVLAVSVWRYRKFMRQNRAERYSAIKYSRATELVIEITVVFFMLGYLVCIIDVLRRDVEPIFIFICVVFAAGAMFVGALMRFHTSMAASLREKTMDVMRSFVTAIEMKDPYTQGHSWHVYHIVLAFCKTLPLAVRQRINEPKLLDAALLHDIGKIGVPDEVLKKRGPLSDEEWEAIKSHPRLGKQMLTGTCYAEISDWVLYHHERMDGQGYHNLPGAEIPLEARIIAVADTYSAITTDREYRPKRSHEEALQTMREVAGTQLDAELMDYFAEIPGHEMETLSQLLRTRSHPVA